jgi:hypothetical protein
MAAMTGSLGLLALESGFTAAVSVFGGLATRIRAHAVMYRHGCSRSEPTIRPRALHKASPARYRGEVEPSWDAFVTQGGAVIWQWSVSSSSLYKVLQ